MAHRITLLPGDGIGPEVSAAVSRVIEAVGVEIEWERFIVGGHAQDVAGSSLPDEVIESIRRNCVALKGPVATPIGGGFESVNVRLRKILDLYANLRPVRNLPGVTSRFGDVDLIIVRENTEGLYSGLEHEVVPGVVESLKIVTEKASTRISLFAFEYAKKFGRKKVTAVHKANIMKKSDGLFLQCFRKVAVNYPSIEHDEKIVDNLCMQLVESVSIRHAADGEPVRRHRVGLCDRTGRRTGRCPQRQPRRKAALFEAVQRRSGHRRKESGEPTALLCLHHDAAAYRRTAAGDRIEAALNKVLEKREKVTTSAAMRPQANSPTRSLPHCSGGL
jgi:isocitrate dehydrogenase (NAD+)